MSLICLRPQGYADQIIRTVPCDDYLLDFPLQAATFKRSGHNLVIGFKYQGSIIMQGFFFVWRLGAKTRQPIFFTDSGGQYLLHELLAMSDTASGRGLAGLADFEVSVKTLNPPHFPHRYFACPQDYQKACDSLSKILQPDGNIAESLTGKPGIAPVQADPFGGMIPKTPPGRTDASVPEQPCWNFPSLAGKLANMLDSRLDEEIRADDSPLLVLITAGPPRRSPGGCNTSLLSLSDLPGAGQGLVLNLADGRQRMVLEAENTEEFNQYHQGWLEALWFDQWKELNVESIQISTPGCAPPLGLAWLAGIIHEYNYLYGENGVQGKGRAIRLEYAEFDSTAALIQAQITEEPDLIDQLMPLPLHGEYKYSNRQFNFELDIDPHFLSKIGNTDLDPQLLELQEPEAQAFGQRLEEELMEVEHSDWPPDRRE